MVAVAVVRAGLGSAGQTFPIFKCGQSDSISRYGRVRVRHLGRTHMARLVDEPAPGEASVFFRVPRREHVVEEVRTTEDRTAVVMRSATVQ